MTSTTERVECVVVGAGVVGLAIARALALDQREVLLVDSQGAIGTQISARNSEVIHAGMYYPTESLKAQCCVRGNGLLYAYCDLRAVPYQKCGKFIVATEDAQVKQLQQIHNRALANGIADLEFLTGQQAQQDEPELRCVAALKSPSTGILDAASLMLALLGDFENAGGMLVLHTEVAECHVAPAGLELLTGDGTRLLAHTVINAAGLGAVPLARNIKGLDSKWVPAEFFAKGNYFGLSGRSPFGRLIYPIPQHGGLGVHLTIDLGGQARFGPDVQWVDSPDDLQVDAERASGFYSAVRTYWPGLPDGALVPAYAGMRPKISGPSDRVADFCIQGPSVHGVAGLVNLFGIESPGLTSCLAIAEHVMSLLRASESA